MPTYRGPDGVLVTTPEDLSDAQLDGVLSGTLSIPGVTVDRGGNRPAGPAPVLPDVKPTLPPGWPTPPPRDTAFGIDIARPGETVTKFTDPKLWQGGQALGSLPSWEGFKKKLPDIATDTALTMIGTPGIGGTALRTLMGIGAGTATASLTGQPVEDQALKSGVAAVGGDVVGGLAKAGVRTGLAGLSRATGAVGRWFGDTVGAGNTVVNLGETAGRLVPAFKGKTPRETISRILDGSGVRQLGEDYGQAVEGVLQQYGNPRLTIPALDKLGIPSTLSATEINLFLKSRGRALFDEAGKMRRSKDAVVEGYWIDKAHEQFEQALTQHLPKAATDGMTAARDMFARGKLIQRLMTEGRETLTDAQLARLMHQGRLNEPLLERTFKRMGGKLEGRFSPGEYAELQHAIRRGEVDPLAFSQPGKGPTVTWGRGSKLPHASVPTAPVRIGRPEEVADTMARIFRLLGATGVQGVLAE